MKTFITVMVSVIVSLATLFIWNLGVERQEKSECLKWQEEALTFPDYYLTSWQKQQCDSYNIEIDAPVKLLPRM